MDATDKRARDANLLLVAVEPRAYRDIIGQAIAALRPALSVRIVEPGDLVTQTAWLRRGLVLCSRKKHPTARSGIAWIS